MIIIRMFDAAHNQRSCVSVLCVTFDYSMEYQTSDAWLPWWTLTLGVRLVISSFWRQQEGLGSVTGQAHVRGVDEVWTTKLPMLYDTRCSTSKMFQIKK